MSTVTQPYALAREEGEALWFMGVPTRVLATSEQTGGAFGLIEHVIPAGDESPWHVHHAEDEAFYVVEGTQPARMLLQCTPGGFEHFVIEMSESAPPSGPPDMEKLMALAAKYDNEILGPLPEH